MPSRLLPWVLALVPVALMACDRSEPAPAGDGGNKEAPAKATPKAAETPAAETPKKPDAPAEPTTPAEDEPTPKAPPEAKAVALPALPAGAPNLELVVMHEGELLGSQMKKLTKLHKRLEAELGAVPIVLEPSVSSRPDQEPPTAPEGTRDLAEARGKTLERWLDADAAARRELLADAAWTNEAIDPTAEGAAGSMLVLWFTAPRELSSGKRRGKGVKVMALLRRDADGLHEVLHSLVRGGGPGSPFPLNPRGDGVPDFAESLVPLVNTRSP